MKITVSWDVTPCSLIDVCSHSNQLPPRSGRRVSVQGEGMDLGKWGPEPGL